jgi:Ni2+-binding GTPase involved in maturation of urease and hydrogenase
MEYTQNSKMFFDGSSNAVTLSASNDATNNAEPVQTDRLNTIERLCSELHLCIVAGDHSNMVDCVIQLSSLVNKKDDAFLNLSELLACRIANAFVVIGQLLVAPSQIAVSDGITQCMADVTLLTYFEKIKSQHYHKSGDYTCDFHMESLFAHLHMAAVSAMAYTLWTNPECTDDELILIGTMAFLHDIGKISTLEEINDGPNKWVGYRFHGEMGAGILAMLWSDAYVTIHPVFTKDNWEHLSRVVCVHMCGYHDTDPSSANSLYKHPLLCIECKHVKQLLIPMSIGDNFGGVKADRVAENCADIVGTRDAFAVAISADGIATFVERNPFKAFVIFVRGMSGSGKSTIVQQFVNHFESVGHTCVVMSRDIIICDVVAAYLGEPVAGIKPDGAIYSRYYSVFAGSKDKKLLAEHVQREMKRVVEVGINNHNIVIVDTVMSLFNAIKFSVPANLSEAFVMSIDVVRNELMTDEGGRMGMTLEKQLQIAGKKDIFSWLPPDAVKNAQNLTSVSTAMDITRPSPQTKPRSCHVVTWNKLYTTGLTEALHQATLLAESYCKKPENLVANMGLIDKANALYKELGWNGMLQWFEERYYTARCPSAFKEFASDRMVMIKYLEHNRLWSEKWNRDARGAVLYLNDNGLIVPLKWALQRGAEVLTGQQCKAGIVTQDCDGKDNSQFDLSQQDTIKRLSSKSSIEGVASSKVDGSLFLATCFFGSYALIADEWVTNHGDSFSKAVWLQGKRHGLTIILSTQGTFMMTDLDMQCYTVTAMLGEYVEKFDASMTPDIAVTTYGIDWFDRFARLVEIVNVKHDEISLTFSFETVCANRTTCAGKEHTELAIRYDRSFLKFLGLSRCTERFASFVPHFAITEPIPFDQPFYWEISHADQIENMATSLGSLTRKLIKVEEFFLLHPPSNAYRVQYSFIDFEGFVFYTKLSDGCYDYGKIKTDEYYNGHKLRLGSKSNIGYLLELAKTSSDIFPLAHRVSLFFDGLDAKIINLVTIVRDDLDKSKSTNNKLFEALPTKAKVTFGVKSFETQCKMLMNASDAFEGVAYDAFCEAFNCDPSEFVPSKVAHHVKNLAMSFKIWQEDCDLINQSIRVAASNAESCEVLMSFYELFI